MQGHRQMRMNKIQSGIKHFTTKRVFAIHFGPNLVGNSLGKSHQNNTKIISKIISSGWLEGWTPQIIQRSSISVFVLALFKSSLTYRTRGSTSTYSGLTGCPVHNLKIITRRSCSRCNSWSGKRRHGLRPDSPGILDGVQSLPPLARGLDLSKGIH